MRFAIECVLEAKRFLREIFDKTLEKAADPDDSDPFFGEGPEIAAQGD